MHRALAGEAASPQLADALGDDALTLAQRGGQLAVLRTDSLCAAVFDAEKRLCFATSAWQTAAIAPDIEALWAAPAAQPLMTSSGNGEMAMMMLRADAETARDWALPGSVGRALRGPEAKMLVLAVRPAATEAALDASGRALGLTRQQCRVVKAVLKTGSIRTAASDIGLGYDTARRAISDAMDRVGVSRLPALLDKVMMLTLGIWPELDGTDTAQLLADMLGLSLRQARLALALALGLTRAEAAAATGLSAAVAKKEIDQLFIVTGVNSAAALVRRLAEARALGMLSSVASGVVWADDDVSPLRFVVRADGSRIALSDHGPPGAPPVLVVHSSMTTRHVATPLLRALQRAGYRVLAIDRPGFGLSDMVAAPCPFAAALDDMARVLDALKLTRVAVLTRGAAPLALLAGRQMAGNQMAGRLGPVVLINPDPPSGLSGEANGVVSVIKALFVKNPAMVAGFARLVANQYTPARAETMIRRAVAASPPDRDFMADPRNVADYYRASCAFTTGRLAGYIAEQVAFATLQADAPLAGTTDWTVLLGERDVIYDATQTAEYWRRTLPDAQRSVVRGAGRFLAMTHCDAVLAALSSAERLTKI